MNGSPGKSGFRFRLFGTGIVSVVGGDFTNRYIDEMIDMSQYADVAKALFDIVDGRYGLLTREELRVEP